MGSVGLVGWVAFTVLPCLCIELSSACMSAPVRGAVKAVFVQAALLAVHLEE